MARAWARDNSIRFRNVAEEEGKKSLKRGIFRNLVVHLVFFVEIFYFEEEE